MRESLVTIIEWTQYLAVEDILWSGLLKLDVPHQGNTIRFMGSVFIVVIRGNKQLRILQER